jgi:hypothetical protein
MAKDEYTELLQQALVRETNKLFKGTWCIEGLEAKYEYGKDMPGTFHGLIDIGISDSSKPDSILGIEIEHWSNPRQAQKNINKHRLWAHNSSKRYCGLLHILHENCHLDDDDILSMLDFARQHQSRGLGFYYDYMFYRTRSRLAGTVAKEIVNSKEYRVRLYDLLKQVNICE